MKNKIHRAKSCLNALNLLIPLLLLACSLRAQEVLDVLNAFNALNPAPEVLHLDNSIQVPTEKGHLQGIQVFLEDDQEKLLLSGSSQTQAYVLQADIQSRRTEKLSILMNDPFRHAGGIQVSGSKLIVGIEDNFIKTSAKVSIYEVQSEAFAQHPLITIVRTGVPEAYTAGATGLIRVNSGYVAVVSNWDSRDWDFYQISSDFKTYQHLNRFEAPDDWGAYQSINLIMDKNAIYAIGFFQDDDKGQADLIKVSSSAQFVPIMKKIQTKKFTCTFGVNFSTAAGLQVDSEGALHLWVTSRDAKKQIAIARYSSQ